MTQTVTAVAPPKTHSKAAPGAASEPADGFTAALELSAAYTASGPEPPGADPPTHGASARTAHAEGAESGSETPAPTGAVVASDASMAALETNLKSLHGGGEPELAAAMEAPAETIADSGSSAAAGATNATPAATSAPASSTGEPVAPGPLVAGGDGQASPKDQPAAAPAAPEAARPLDPSSALPATNADPSGLPQPAPTAAGAAVDTVPSSTSALPGPAAAEAGAAPVAEPTTSTATQATPAAIQTTTAATQAATVAPPPAQAGAESPVQPNAASDANPQGTTRAEGSGTGSAQLAPAEQHNAQQGKEARPSDPVRLEPAASQQQQTGAMREGPAERRPDSAPSSPNGPLPVAALENAAAELRSAETPRPTAEMPRMHARLHDLGARTETAIRLAVRGGHSFAHITMRPPELGTIEIRLQYRAGEVVAEVRAESAQALGVLSQAVTDLRRQLEAQGITLADLQLRHSNGDDASRDEAANPTQHSRGGGTTPVAEDDTNELAIEAMRRHPAAVRLDVLA